MSAVKPFLNVTLLTIYLFSIRISNRCLIACCNLRMFWFCFWTSALIKASILASLLVRFYCNCEKIRCKWGLQSTAARFLMGSWSISPRMYSRILVPLWHRHPNAKPKFITAMNCCFSTRNRSSNPVSARKKLTTTAPKFVQRYITARAKLAKQRCSNFQDYCVGLADPSVLKRVFSGAKRWLDLVRPVVNLGGAKNCIFLTARNSLCTSKHLERSEVP